LHIRLWNIEKRFLPVNKKGQIISCPEKLRYISASVEALAVKNISNNIIIRAMMIIGLLGLGHVGERRAMRRRFCGLT
jgi:hypothetical protein